LKCSTEEAANTLRCYDSLIETLTFSSSLTMLVGKDPPEGCCVQTVSARCETHLMLKVSSLCLLFIN